MTDDTYTHPRLGRRIYLDELYELFDRRREPNQLRRYFLRDKRKFLGKGRDPYWWELHVREYFAKQETDAGAET